MEKVIKGRIEELKEILETRQEQKEQIEKQQKQLEQQDEIVGNDILACQASMQELQNLLKSDEEEGE